MISDDELMKQVIERTIFYLFCFLFNILGTSMRLFGAIFICVVTYVFQKKLLKKLKMKQMFLFSYDKTSLYNNYGVYFIFFCIPREL